MDSDDDFDDMDTVSTSSRKGPPPRKKTRRLTPTEKKRKSRQMQSVVKKQEELVKNKNRTAEQRKELTKDKVVEEMAKTKNRLAVAKHRAKQEKEKKDEELVKNRLRNCKQRGKKQTKEKVVEEMANTKNRVAMHRANQAKVKKDDALVKNRVRNAIKRQNDRTKVEYKEALKTQVILEGSYKVNDLKDTDDSIGEMEHICKHCSALKFEKETSSTCCLNGKVNLERFPTPPPEINKLLKANTVKGKVFRDNARSINNAVCLTSIKVNHRHFKQGFNPSIIFEGRVQQLAGPIQAAEGEQPCFAQLYVHDASM